MDPLAKTAIEVLHRHDRGTWTRPSGGVHPHHGSWDASFTAMGWAQLDPMRGVSELWSLLRGQWATGMIPHLVFDRSVPSGRAETGPAVWATEGHAPSGTATSAICQPPLHALALLRVREAAASRGAAAVREVDDAVVDLYPRLDRWHRWLRTARDPEGTGLTTILHPWESGLDNSPRWDRPLSRIDPGDDAPAPRADLLPVADPADRPSTAEHQRNRHLVHLLVDLDHDQARAMDEHPFRVADVLSSAILAASDDALAELAPIAGHPGEVDRHRADGDRTRAALEACWDDELGACLDQDRTTGRPIRSDTVAGFAPLIAGCSIDRAAVLVDRLLGPSYAGADGLAWRLPLTTATTDPRFDRRACWRGPQWPPITWLLWWGLRRLGHRRSARTMRADGLDQLRDIGCTAFVEPFSGEPLGAREQSSTAAVALDWLAHDD